ncbi:hypothetical protein DENSPDRAFT_638187 [Dentipellis sp. KUC8613]|nr:hypothetical protein DENSPDRAFT_638187 [Dentipellis sp. KUC8613]
MIRYKPSKSVFPFCFALTTDGWSCHSRNKRRSLFGVHLWSYVFGCIRYSRYTLSSFSQSFALLRCSPPLGFCSNSFEHSDCTSSYYLLALYTSQGSAVDLRNIAFFAVDN